MKYILIFLLPVCLFAQWDGTPWDGYGWDRTSDFPNTILDSEPYFYVDASLLDATDGDTLVVWFWKQPY